MVQGRWFPVGADLSEAIRVRQLVFGRGADELDGMSQQVVVYGADGQAVGAARLWWADGAFRLGDVGVVESERSKGFGDLLVRLLLYKSLTHSATLIALDAPEAVAPFFEKYGFSRGTHANELVAMSILARDVQLSHCGGDCARCDHPSAECAPKALR